MGIAFKCDVCGNLFEGSPRFGASEAVTVEPITTAIAVKFTANVPVEPRSAELCPQCSAESVSIAASVMINRILGVNEDES